MKIIHCPTKKEKNYIKIDPRDIILIKSLLKQKYKHQQILDFINEYVMPEKPITKAKDFLKPEIPLWRKLKEFRFKGKEMLVKIRITDMCEYIHLNDNDYKQLANYIKRNV